MSLKVCYFGFVCLSWVGKYKREKVVWICLTLKSRRKIKKGYWTWKMWIKFYFSNSHFLYIIFSFSPYYLFWSLFTFNNSSSKPQSHSSLPFLSSGSSQFLTMSSCKSSEIAKNHKGILPKLKNSITLPKYWNNVRKVFLRLII